MPTSCPGDYNEDGGCDAADYTVWQDHLGPNASIPNDLTPGRVAREDYEIWVINFGAVAAGRSLGIAGSAPEPGTMLLLVTGASGLLLARRRTASRR